MKKNLMPIISVLITLITIGAYIALLFISGIGFATEQQPIVVLISGITIFSIFANMVSYWAMMEQIVLDSDDMKKEYSGYDDYVASNIKDTFDFDKVINAEYNAHKRTQKKNEIYKRYLNNDLILRFINRRISNKEPRIRFIERTLNYKNRDKILYRLKAQLEYWQSKKEMREGILDIRAITLSSSYRQITPENILTRNNDNNKIADGINKLGRHKSVFMISRTLFSTITTFFPILFVFAISGTINNDFIMPIIFGSSAVVITILQTILFARKYTKNDTLEYLGDLFYICKWYVSFRTNNPAKTLEQPKQEQSKLVIGDLRLLDICDSTSKPNHHVPNLNDELVAKN